MHLHAQVVTSLAACEDLCYNKTSGSPCQSFTWHHTDFPKAIYRGHCYAHTDSEWAPVSQSKIDSGCRNDLPIGAGRPPCSRHPAPAPPTPPPSVPFHCKSDFDCSGHNGVCTDGTCKCNLGWSGTMCSAIDFVPRTARVAYTDPLWTWGGSPIMEVSSASDSGAVYHLFSSRMSNNCGILHVTALAKSTTPLVESPFVLAQYRRVLTVAFRTAVPVLHELGGDSLDRCKCQRSVQLC
jgi:hypothetical protein